MSSGDDQLGEVAVPLFRPFTQESLAAMEARIAKQEGPNAEQNRLKAEGANGMDGVPEHYSSTDHDQKLEPDPILEAGMLLPRKLARNLPSEFIATPIQDLDKYYENEKTYMIINKGKRIFRLSATNSLFILSPFNLLRRLAICLIVHPAFNFLIMAAILINCMFMTMPSNPTVEMTEGIFLLIYTVESIIKIIALGFILGKFTYLRDPWNWLDFILNALGFLDMVIDLGPLRLSRTFRALRVLNIGIRGLKITVGAVIESVKNLRDAIILTLFSLTVFALLGLQLYMGVLTQKCVRNPDPNLNISWDDYISIYSNIEENWLKEDGEYIMCGNSSGTRHCPSGSTCVQGVGSNPDYGYTTFDSFPWSLLSVFRFMTQDFWESLYRMVMITAGPWNMCFFVLIIFWCTFYLVYIFLAVLAKYFGEFINKVYEDEEEIAAKKVALQSAAGATDAEAEEPNRPVSAESDDYFPKKETVVTVVNMKGGDEKEKPLKERPKGCFSKCTDIFCVWDCCACWVRFQEIASLIVLDPFMELFVTLCVVLNVLFMAFDHHDMEPGFERLLHNGNNFFTAVYVIEAALKIIVLSPKYYFRNGWNKFDFFIAVSSLLELALEGIQGLSVLRAFRLLRAFKLAKSWPTFNLMLSIMCKTTGVGAFGNLCLVLGVIIFIFATIGKETFGRNYFEYKHFFYNGEVPRWNFVDFMHSFMTVFRALCGEWIETMWDCMLVAGWTCIPFYVSLVVIGNLVVMNLLFAVLVFSTSTVFLEYSRLGLVPSDTGNTKQLQEAIARFSRFKKALLQVLKPFRAKLTTQQTADETSEMMRKDLPESLTTEAVEDGSQLSLGEPDADKLDSNKVECIILDENPPDCCPDCCYVRSPFCRRDKLQWVGWNRARKLCFYVADHKYFERVTITMILISCLALAVEDVYLKDRPLLKEILQYMDKVFAVFFLFEMLLQWLAFGFKIYFTNRWYWINFINALVYMYYLVAEFAGCAFIPVFKIVRTLRVLHPLCVWKSRMAFSMLVQAIPASFNLFLVCLFVWLIFAILGVQLMGGKFYSCVGLDNNKLNTSYVSHRYDCLIHNFTWINTKINFDNVPNAYLALLQVATFKGWIQIMYGGVDSTMIDEQPEEEGSIYMYLYFVYFIILCVFFALSLLIGVIIHNFNQQRRKFGMSLEMFMTEDQKVYYNGIKKRGSKKPVKAIPKPEFKLQAIVFDLVRSKKFDIVIVFFICLNMIVLAMEHYNPTPLYDTILAKLDLFCIGIFTVECVLKIFGLRMYYFKKSWNVFDFVVVTLSILGILLKDLIATYYYIPPSILRMFCVVKVGRVVRLLKFLLLFKGIKTLLFVLTKSLPEFFNIFLLHYLVIFIYAILGMFFFMNIRHRAGIDQNVNFETFGQTMLLLFQLATSAGWDNVLAALMDEDDCNIGEDGDCGSHNIAITYVVSYLIMNFLLIIMYIAVFLDNYSQTTDDVQEGLTEDDYDMFYEIWQNFDPDATQFIPYSDLSTFLDSLKEPLRIPKPNENKIITMNIPISEGDLVFCGDVLDALNKNFFQMKGRNIDVLAELEVLLKDTEGYNPTNTTLIRQREMYPARGIQFAWRSYKGNEKEPKMKSVV